MVCLEKKSRTAFISDIKYVDKTGYQFTLKYSKKIHIPIHF